MSPDRRRITLYYDWAHNVWRWRPWWLFGLSIVAPMQLPRPRNLEKGWRR